LHTNGISANVACAQIGARIHSPTLVCTSLKAPESWSLSDIFSFRQWRAKEEEEATTKAFIPADDGIYRASESSGAGRSAETIAQSNQEQAVQ
jgi:hypothetical protein